MVYFAVSRTDLSPPQSRHSGVCFLKLILKRLLLSLEFLRAEAKVIHTGKSNRIEEYTVAFYSSGLSIAVTV
jgi:hypothetical protein